MSASTVPRYSGTSFRARVISTSSSSSRTMSTAQSSNGSPTRSASDRSMPASGLEASVVARTAAASPAPPWPFFVHVTTAPKDPKVVSGRTQSGDPDLILHYAVARERGWSATGPPPVELFGSIPTSIVLQQIADELRWAASNASASYAVLNACRASVSRSRGGSAPSRKAVSGRSNAASSQSSSRPALNARALGTSSPPRTRSKAMGAGGG